MSASRNQDPNDSSEPAFKSMSQLVAEFARDALALSEGRGIGEGKPSLSDWMRRVQENYNNPLAGGSIVDFLKDLSPEQSAETFKPMPSPLEAPVIPLEKREALRRMLDTAKEMTDWIPGEKGEEIRASLDPGKAGPTMH